MGRWTAVCALLYASTLIVDVSHGEYNRLVAPLEQIRHFAEPLMFAMLMVVAATMFLTSGSTARRSIPRGAIFFACFLLVFDLRMVVSGAILRGILGIVAHGGLIVGLFLGLSSQLRSFRDVHIVLRCVAVTAAIFAISTCVQLAVRPSAVIFGYRLQSTFNNAQSAALYIAIALLPACYLLAQRTEPKLWRLAMGVLAGLLFVFLLWTGSRTGLLMTLASLPLLLRFRVGRIAFVGSAGALFIYVALQFFAADLNPTINRLLTPMDNRSYLWQESINEFTANPLIGAGMTEAAFHENSYLSAAATTGIVGLIPFTLAFVLIAGTLVRLQKIRRHLGEYVMLADLVTAGLVSLAVGAVFESLLLGTLTNPIMMLAIYLTLLRFVLDPATIAMAQTDAAQLEDSDPLNPSGAGGSHFKDHYAYDSAF